MAPTTVIANPIINSPFEVTGQAHPDKQAKTDTAEKLWAPAVNNAGQWGRWGFVETTDP